MPFPQLSGEVAEYVDGNTHAQLVEENRQLRIQVRQLDDALRQERLKAEAAASGVRELRRMLSQPFKAMQAIFGEIDQMGIEETTATPQVSNAKWESWKASMPGRPAQFIDLLLVHDSMSVKQLMVAAKCAQQTVYDTASKMIRAGILEKNSGGRYSLKSL